jgi:hydrophobe/amphiphile efflux-1 (HAE1) family protein
MNFARFFIDRPVLAIVLSLVIVIAGVISIPNLPVAQYPEIVPPTVIVSASYPGANAQVIADTVAAPIEQQVNGVEGLLYLSSNSVDGAYNLTATFKLGTNLDTAQVQVQNRVAIAQPQLPSDVQRIGVTVRKSSPDLTLAVRLYSPHESYDRLYLSNYALLQLREQIARLPGVGDIRIFGARDYAMRIWLDPQKVAAQNMTASDVVSAIREQNVQVAAGVVGAQPLPVGASSYQLTISAEGRLVTKEQFENIVIKTGANGSISRLKDVARVELGAGDYSQYVYTDGQESVGIGVFQLPGTNAIATADAIYAKMAELKKTFPPDVDYSIPYDTTIFVRESISDVVKTLLEAVLLVVIVVIVFLQNWRAAVIPLMAIPVSLVGTFAVMYIMGFSLNNLSLFGIVLAIGIVVDDAIVVVENTERWIEKGYPPKQAAYHSMEEVTTAVIAIAFGLSAVFIPTAFISGVTGQFYKQFALTIASSTLLSAFNSLTLSPAMCALILKPRHGKRDPLQWVIQILAGWFFLLFNKGLEWTTAGYAKVLRGFVKVSIVGLLIYGGFLVLTYEGFQHVPTGFIPTQDSGYFVANVQLPDGASLQRTDDVMKRMMEVTNHTEGVQDTFAVVGLSFLTQSSQSNSGAMFVVLKPFKEREKNPAMTWQALMGKLQGTFSTFQEAQIQLFPAPPVRGLSTAGGFKLQVEDRSGRYSSQQLEAAVNTVANAARGERNIFNPQTIFSSFRSNVPQLHLDINREKLKTQNVPVTSVFDTLQIYLGSLYVNDFNYLGRTYRVNAQAEAPYRANADDIGKLKTRNAAGQMVPLASVVDVKETTGPSRLNRYNLYNSAELNGAPAVGVSTGTANAEMVKLAHQLLPPGMDVEWTELTFQEQLAGEGWNSPLLIFPLCVLFVFLTHAAEYESFPLSLSIIMIVPMCLFSAIMAHWYLKLENNIFTQIGFVVLVGLSAKNAVLIVEFAKQQEEHGKSFFEAPIEAARLRLRPILMTSFSFILGVVPLLTAKGAGAEMRHALGYAVFFGMLGVTFFGLFLTPVFYYTIRWITVRIFHGKQHMRSGVHAQPQLVPAHAPTLCPTDPAPVPLEASPWPVDGEGHGNGSAKPAKPGDGKPAEEMVAAKTNGD